MNPADQLDAVSRFLLEDARPASADPAVAFQLLISAHLLAALGRARATLD